MLPLNFRKCGPFRMGVIRAGVRILKLLVLAIRAGRLSTLEAMEEMETVLSPCFESLLTTIYGALRKPETSGVTIQLERGNEAIAYVDVRRRSREKSPPSWNHGANAGSFQVRPIWHQISDKLPCRPSLRGTGQSDVSAIGPDRKKAQYKGRW